MLKLLLFLLLLFLLFLSSYYSLLSKKILIKKFIKINKINFILYFSIYNRKFIMIKIITKFTAIYIQRITKKMIPNFWQQITIVFT